ncbi:MAG: single-stranded-DNA-specific exonuclease RecJ [Patescibacteria group bacterium]|nr:single-stranded-DNA-specific exonuclease RecJ [Patescibacteria group bacterium]
MSNREQNWKMLSGWGNREPILDLPKWFLSILANRGSKDKKAIEDYLEPKYEDLVSYDNFLGIIEAVTRLHKAKDNNEKIVIYGDYDVDGICSVAIISETLNTIGVQNIETYIPHRTDEGYGLNEEALKEIVKNKGDLVIAVDCGITSRELIDEEKNLDFIVIDHHEVDKKKLPQKSINIHPALTKDGGNYELSAGGMAFIVARAVQAEFPEEIPENQEKWLLDLAALSTICDVMPLTGNNRIIAKYGLMVLSKTKRVGLTELMKMASIDKGEVSAYDVGFVIGPRLNAAGRLEHAKNALELLLTKEETKAKEIAKELSRLNSERQDLCNRIIEEARAEIEKGDKKAEMFLLSSRNWPRGVVGIVAGRLAESYARPVIVFEDDGKEMHGSARSVGDFDITATLTECEDCLLSFGGHAKAAGVKVASEHFVAFSDKILQIAKDKIKLEELKKEIEIDTKIEKTDINDETMNHILKMEPFGYGNHQPIFLFPGATVSNINRVGKDKGHLKFKIDIDKEKIGGIAFREEREMKEGEYDLVLNLKYNIWNGNKSIEARVIDFRESRK